MMKNNDLIYWLLVFTILLLTGCGVAAEYGPPDTRTFGREAATVQEVTFFSAPFTLVGDLRLPVEGEQHPAVILVHGDGQATRHGAVTLGPMIELFLRNGYAVLSWDKPGSGASTGAFEHALRQRAAILSDAVHVLADNPAIDGSRIGLWGISQAGWVMPLALEENNGVAFMIVASGGAEDSLEQMGYLMGQRVLTAGGTAAEAAVMEQNYPQIGKARTYAAYRAAMDNLHTIPDLDRKIGFTIEDKTEAEWTPWPEDIDAFFDPVAVLEQTTIPVLAFFGERDRYIDPVQGAAAYTAALEEAGNLDYEVIVLPHLDHVFTTHPDYLQALESWLQHFPGN
jgi:pimeloyl-ACP methyl ester carboxylesterase